MLLCLVLVALALRIHVARNVPVEVDEDNYLSAALDYRRGLDARDLYAITHVQRNYEHPPFVKILYALTMDQQEVDSLPRKLYPGFMEKLPTSLDRARGQSIFSGVLTVFIVGLMNPFAGLVMATQSMQVYYTGVAYLDALPVLFISLMAWAYRHKPPENRSFNPYFWLSAIFFGAAVAAKYPYALVGAVLITHALVYRHHSLKKLVLWGLIAVAVFFWLNPYIWPDPVARLKAQLTFHTDYGLGRNYSVFTPWGQMLYPRQDIRYDQSLVLHPIVDLVFFLLAVPGGYVLLRQKSLFGWWLVAGVLFQMLWPAQWIQHNMIMIVPYSFSAAVMFQRLVQQIQEKSLWITSNSN